MKAPSVVKVFIGTIGVCGTIFRCRIEGRTGTLSITVHVVIQRLDDQGRSGALGDPLTEQINSFDVAEDTVAECRHATDGVVRISQINLGERSRDDAVVEHIGRTNGRGWVEVKHL